MLALLFSLEESLSNIGNTSGGISEGSCPAFSASSFMLALVFSLDESLSNIGNTVCRFLSSSSAACCPSPLGSSPACSVDGNCSSTFLFGCIMGDSMISSSEFDLSRRLSSSRVLDSLSEDSSSEGTSESPSSFSCASADNVFMPEGNDLLDSDGGGNSKSSSESSSESALCESPLEF